MCYIIEVTFNILQCVLLHINHTLQELFLIECQIITTQISSNSKMWVCWSRVSEWRLNRVGVDNTDNIIQSISKCSVIDYGLGILTTSDSQWQTEVNSKWRDENYLEMHERCSNCSIEKPALTNINNAHVYAGPGSGLCRLYWGHSPFTI